MRITWRPQCARVFAALEALQVELHGHYSVERFDAFQRYKQSTSCVRAALVLLLTPLPCLVAIVGADLLPLEPPHTGLEHNRTFWLRAYVGVWIFTLSFVHQFHHTLPMIPMSTRQIWTISAVVSTAGLGCSYVTALAIGFPVPFMMVTRSPGWALLLVLSLRWSWGPFLKQHSRVLGAVKNCIRIFQVQMAMLIVCPVYSYVFAQLSSYQQTLFSVVLQLIKLASKLAISEFVCAAEDMQPEVVILNAEVFHALFVAVCLQNSSSVTTSVVLLAVDALAACLAVYDVNKIVSKLHALNDEIDRLRAASLAGVSSAVPEVPETTTTADAVDIAKPSSDDTAFALPTEAVRPAVRVFARHEMVERTADILERNVRVRTSSSVRKRAFAWFEARSSNRIAPNANSPTKSTANEPSQRPIAGHKVVPITATSSSSSLEGALEHQHTGAHALKTLAILPGTPSPIECASTAPSLASTSSSSPITRTVIQVKPVPLTGAEAAKRLESELEPAYVKQTLSLLHVTEFLILVEYTEVIIPIVYSVYLLAMSHLPNYIYYPQLARMNGDKLTLTVANVQLYAALELATFVLLHCTLRRRVRYLLLLQLMFVLERQWKMVQSKLILWVLYIVQSSLEHFGADYTFEFAWLNT